MKSAHAPKRSNSFYDSVVEDMLESVCSDISSTHYSRRRSTIRGGKSSPRKVHEDTSVESPNASMVGSRVKEEVKQTEGQSPVKITNLSSPRSVFVFFQ